MGPEQKQAVQEILTQIKSAPQLHLIDKDEPIYIAIDSSYTGSGSIFYQLINDRKNIIHYHSLTFTTMEKKGLGSLQKELLGLIRTLSLNKRIIHTHPAGLRLLWRSGKSQDIIFADYLSRYVNDNRHTLLYTKFSNKLPKLTEDDLSKQEWDIPDRYKIMDNPITYSRLIQIFQELKGDENVPLNTSQYTM